MHDSTKLTPSTATLMVCLGAGVVAISTTLVFAESEPKPAYSGQFQNSTGGAAGAGGQQTYNNSDFSGFEANPSYGGSSNYGGNPPTGYGQDNKPPQTGGGYIQQPQTGGGYAQQPATLQSAMSEQQNYTPNYNLRPTPEIPNSNVPPAGYAKQGSYAPQPQGYNAAPAGYAGPGYGAPPAGYAGPGYGAPPAGYAGPGYGAPPAGYAGPGYGAPPASYAGPGYGAPPVGYAGPGYGAPPLGYGGTGYGPGGPGYDGYGDQGYYGDPYSRSDYGRGPFSSMPGPMKSMPNPMRMFGGGNRD